MEQFIDSAQRILYLAFAAASIWALTSHLAVAAGDGNNNGIQSVSATPSAGGSIAIKIGFKNAIANQIAAFTLSTPPRIAFDFQNTTNELGKSFQEFGAGDLHSVNIVQAGTRTRLVINLNQMMNYDTRINGNSVVIMLQRRVITSNESIVPIEANGSVSKQLKQISLKQQAENEFRQANLLAQQGRPREAATGYITALNIDPAHVTAREALVAVLLESNLNADAEKTLEEGLEQNPQQTHFAMLLARLQVERNALPLALDTLEKTLPYANQKPDYQAFVAALLQRQNRHAEAITSYRAALQMSPNSGLWQMGLGISLQATQHKAEARDAYNRAIEAHNLSPELQSFVAQRIIDIK
jgi:tetratricopeptide (TPR) repeat protein